MPQDSKQVASSPALTGLNKRQQLARSDKMIFVWVTIAAAVAALSLVSAQFLVRMALFNQDIISHKTQTNEVLEKNKSAADELKQSIESLRANDALGSIQPRRENNLEVILDALPTTGDTTAFSNSIYTKLFEGTGIEPQSIAVGDQSAITADVVAPVATEVAGISLPESMMFSFTVEGDAKRTKTALENIEKVIRPINIISIDMRISEGKITTSINGKTYFLAKSSVELGKKSLQPKSFGGTR